MYVPEARVSNQRRLVRLRLLVIGCATVAVLSGCDRADTPLSAIPAGSSQLSKYVTGDAAQAVNAIGAFSFPQARSPDDRPVITAERAGQLALAYVKTFGPSLKSAWEKERGGPISLENLQIGERILYAQTPYGRFPEGYHPAFATGFGPYYLVPLKVGSQPVLLVSIAAYATELSIGRSGFVTGPVQGGNEFVSKALAVDTSGFRMVSPEEATELVARSTGARITRIPELIRGGMPQSPASALWKLTLDREVGVLVGSDRARARVREIYFGPERGRGMMIAIPGGARSERFPALRVDETGDHHQELVDIDIRNGESVTFRSVVVEGEA